MPSDRPCARKSNWRTPKPRLLSVAASSVRPSPVLPISMPWQKIRVGIPSRAGRSQPSKRNVAAPRHEADALELRAVVGRAILELRLSHPRHSGRHQVADEQVEESEGEEGNCEGEEYQGGNSYGELGRLSRLSSGRLNCYNTAPACPARGKTEAGQSRLNLGFCIN